VVSPKQVLEAHLQALPPKVIDRISPSQLGKCHRSHYYKIKHIEPLVTPTSSALANFQVGFLWEQLIKEALESQKVPFSFQDSFYDPELNMSGSSDFIVGEPGGEQVMWDSKTMASKWFWYRESKRKRNQYDWWEENYGYIIQQGAYLLMAKRLGYNIPKSILAFISKDDGFIGEQLEVYLTPKLEKELLRLIKELNFYLERDEVPPCTCEGWLVGYCDYGNPKTRELNKTKKTVNTECCPDSIEGVERWRHHEAAL
jgi:CRISPR/Cas system-associated exonuclease Cas4 (RecB family)